MQQGIYTLCELLLRNTTRHVQRIEFTLQYIIQKDACFLYDDLEVEVQ